jgi:hypothetical protein
MARSGQAIPLNPPGGSSPPRLVVAIIGAFCFIPFVSDFAFWFSAAAYVVLASTLRHH